MFNVKLESFDAAAKPKIIREVKAIVPNLTLIDVRVPSLILYIVFPFPMHCSLSSHFLPLRHEYSRYLAFSTLPSNLLLTFPL